ncbi:MAG: RNA polymerase sigma factor [Candidatus Aminicenantes bacterium]|nr:RNA polymerase sigma factor [Candidatus Aminicenantes bacterium]
MISDNRIMEEVREGKVEKLAVLFEKHHIKLFNFFLRLTGNRGASEDLVQEVFLRILKYRKTFRGQSKFTVWMYQIARNAHIDFLRKGKDELPLEDQWKEVTGPEPSPPAQLERGQDIDMVRQALAQLPLKKREVLVLSRFQELKYREIADLLGCQIGTVKAHVHRAIKELGRIYGELSGGAVS